MSEIMQQLRKDHANVATLLDILDRHLLAVRRAERADFELMHDVMVYMTSYPDRYHHPMEDLVFERLREKRGEVAEVLDLLEKEHRGLATKGDRFRDLLERVVDGSMVLREELESVGRDYVAFLRHHMQLEDRDAFPAAEDALDEADWRWVSKQIQAAEDPVFGSIVEEQFRDLLRYIEAQVGQR